MFTEMLKAKGQLRVVIKDEHGNIKSDQTFKNLVVDVGKNFIAGRIAQNDLPFMSHMAIGASNVQQVAGDVQLGTELARVALSSATSNLNTVTFVATFNPGVGTGAVTEAGLFNDPTSGTMLARTTFAVVNKGPNDTMTNTWDVSIV